MTFTAPDRTGDLFGSDEIRGRFIGAIEAAGLGDPRMERDLRERPFTVAASITYGLLHGNKAAGTQDGQRRVDEAVSLARHLVRCGYATHKARQDRELVGDDWDELLVFERAARARMAKVDESTAWSDAFAYIAERCEELLQPGQPDADRDDAYAALRYLATRLRTCAGFEDRWALIVGEPE